jgi:hypothetical protein
MEREDPVAGPAAHIAEMIETPEMGGLWGIVNVFMLSDHSWVEK